MNMPEVRLPESALSASYSSNTDGGRMGGGPSSFDVQYGSLRESRYHGGMMGVGLPSSTRYPAADVNERGSLADSFDSSNVGPYARDGGGDVVTHDDTTRGGVVTALDVLTRTNESSRGTTYDDDDNDATVGGVEPIDAPTDGNAMSTRPISDCRGPSFDNYDQQHHVNPDTFEAFDFELE